MYSFLAIDDNESNLISMEGLIKELYPDAQVWTALNGLQGMELAQAMNPDVILLDIFMPVMDGYAVCEKLKQDALLSEIPILFVTAMKETRENQVRAMQTGAEGFLTKPIDHVQLAVMLHAMLKIRSANRLKSKDNQRLEALVLEQTANLRWELEERKRTEQLILENEANIKAIIDNTLENIWSVDTELRIVYANDHFLNEFEHSFGVRLKKGDRIIDNLPVSMQATWHQTYNRAFNQERFVIYDEVKGKEGTVFIEVAVNPIVLNNTVAGISFYGKNVTERVLAEAQLKESKERYKDFFDDDLTGDFLSSSNGRLIDCNPAYLKMLGFSNKEEAFQYDLDKLYPNPDDRKHLLKLVTEKGKLEDFEYTMLDVNGKLMYVISNIIGVFDEKRELKAIKGYIFNNTQRKIAENELRKLSRAVEQNSSSIIITDNQSRIEYVNPKFTQLTGYSLDEVLGKNPRILQSGMTTPETYDSLWSALHSGQEWKGELQNRNKAGDLYLEAASISPILDENGNATHYLAVKEDITEIKRIMDELILTKEKAVESDHLKTAFLMNMSHEIRTPMNGILGFLSLLDEPNLDEDSKREYIQIVNQSAQRLLTTINDIIEISRIESGVLEVNLYEVDLKEQMDFLYDFFLPQAQDKKLEFKLTSQLTGKKAFVNTDRNKLEGILINLIKNAIKFTTAGQIEFGNYLEGDTLVFFVKDTGKGIPPERLTSIFERFVQADVRLTRTHEGSGLGLSIAKAYAAALNGEIQVESTVNVGSTFKFIMPYTVTDSIVPTNGLLEESPSPKDATSKTILIAEDDENSYIYLEVILAEEGFSLIHTVNGREAVETLKEHPEIDLILMDLSMPVMNGLEATSEIRKFNADLPIIAQTAFAFSSDRQRALEAGCNDYISKPISSKSIKQMLYKYLNL